MPDGLPPNPDLRRLRDLARALQRACRTGDAGARARLLATFPAADAAEPPLSRALAVVAREHGIPSWPALKAEVEAQRAAKSGAAAGRNARPLYEGKAKILYEGPDPGTLIQHFKDDATALDGGRRAVLAGKGELNNAISELVMTRLAEAGVQTHFIRRLGPRDQLVRAVEIIPLEVVCRNVVAGSLAQRLGMAEGERLARPILEFHLKDDGLHDPMVSEAHIAAFGWASDAEVAEMQALTLRVDEVLSGLFGAAGLILVDFKLEFGRLREGEAVRIVLADEISPDCCRLWDTTTGEKLDKDRFRRDLGGVVEGYAEVARRLGAALVG